VLKKALEETMPIVKNANPSYLLHEFFEPFNAPCYFKEFLARAGAHELSYLCEAETSAMFVQNYQESVREPLLNECGGSQIVMEQYLDFLVNRTFRQTLLIKSDRASQIQYRLQPERLRALHYAGFFATKDGTSIAIDHGEQACSAIGNRQVMLRNPVHKAVAQTLEERYPATIDVDTLVAEVAARTSEALATAESSTMAMLEELVILGAVRTRCEAPGIALEVSKKPRAIDVVRRSFGAIMQADRPASACSQWHEGVAVVPLESFLLPLLDGHRTHDMLVKDVAKAALAEELVFSKDGQAMGRSEVPNDFVRAEVVKALHSLRRKGFLTA
jgi:methyltransferase-like protein